MGWTAAVVEASGALSDVRVDPDGELNGVDDVDALLRALIRTPEQRARALECVHAASVGSPSSHNLDAGRKLLCVPVPDDMTPAQADLPPGAGAVTLCILPQPRDAAPPSPGDMIAAASHEMASALTAIAGWSELGLDTAAPASHEDALRAIHESATLAQVTAQDLLSLRTFDAASAHVAPRESGISPPQDRLSRQATTDALRVCGDVARIIAPLARINRVSIRVEEETPAPACGCPRASLMSIVWNLVHNAVHVLPEDGLVTLRTGVDYLRGAEQVVVDVIDDGPGMSPEVRARVFDPYYTRRENGTGLGLSVVRVLVERAGGTIEALESDAGGAWFRVALPVASDEEVSTGVLTKGATTAAARVLVVENDHGLREMLELALAMHDFSVQAVGSVAAAERTVGTFDVAVADINLGDGDGERLLERLSNSGRVAGGILITGGDLARGTRFPSLRKPFQPTELAALIQASIRERRAVS